MSFAWIVVLPQKLNFDGTKYRTNGTNEIIELMFLVNNDLAKYKKDKFGSSPNLSSLVPQIVRISNQFWQILSEYMS